MDNTEIARHLTEMADLLEIQGANPFRVRAYRNAVRTIEDQTTPVCRLEDEGGDLTDLSGVGDDMASHLRELCATGRLSQLEELAEEVPRTLIDLMRLPGVGPKRAKKLWEQLEVETVDGLEEAAEEGRVAELDGFGAKTQTKILQGIADYREHQERMRLVDADRAAEPLLEHLRAADAIERLEVAGSYRRRKETVGDLDLLVIAADAGAAMERFHAYDAIERLEMAGDTRASVVLSSGLSVDLRVLPAESYGAALLYFTGSKEHNVRLRQRAIERGLRLSEYGLFRPPEDEDTDGDETDGEGNEEHDPRAGERVASETEAAIYEVLDLAWVPPELREDRGEIERAAEDDLPDLITLDDIRGDLQMHSTWSDGKNTIEEMLEACAGRGYEYFALTDHSKALAMTGGLDEKRLAEQWEEIDEIVERHPEIRLLKSLEIDILADGSLDLADEMIEQLDVVLVSVHSRFDLPADEQTERIVKALSHPEVDILAHPTGRLINRRKPFDFDLEEVLRAAREHGVAVELNAQPDRLDLKDTHLIRARELGVGVVISTDAHTTANLDVMKHGIDQARRAGLEPRHVLNTRPVEEFLAALGG